MASTPPGRLSTLPGSANSTLSRASRMEIDDSQSPGPSPNPAGHSHHLSTSRLSSTAPRPSVLAQRGLGVAAHDPLATPQPSHPYSRRVSNIRPSFSTLRGPSRRVSRAATMHTLDDEDEFKLPTLVPGIRPAYMTPLPVLPMLVLCIAMLSELLSANLSQPFMLRMVERFFLAGGKEKSTELEAAVGLWTGNLVSVFYITQFFTSLLWSSIADRHGRRAVLVASMTGSGLALLMFGTSQSLPEAICVRLIQGIFGGAIGVFRGSIRDITDDTNATRAYAVLGFCWGLGGVIGPILGGVFESPAVNFPNTFLARIPIFQRMPYFLPTLLGGFIMFAGAILACFLSWDGGVRGGSRLQLEIEKDEPLAPPPRNDTLSPVPQRAAPASALRIKNNLPIPENEELGASVYGTSAKMRRDSLASLGTAYGYGGIRSKHPTLAARRAIEAARRVSAMSHRSEQPEGEEEDPRSVSFATKLLLANEDNTFNINDLWLSAAVAQDTAVFDDDDEYDELDDSTTMGDSAFDTSIGDDESPEASPSPSAAHQHTSASARTRARLVSGGSEFARHLRRQSSASRRHSVSSNVVPSIFSNTGLTSTSTPGIVPYDDNDDPFSPPGTGRRPAPALSNLTAIHEQHHSSSEGSPLVSPGRASVSEKQPSRWKLLPLLVICQYALLSLHDSSHGQLFLSFIITPYQSGGVGITPASYSLFVALMCVGQLIYQFYLFPRLGPPIGRFSNLQLFRLGSMLYVPGYLLVPLLHKIASPDSSGGFIVMTAMSMISALRYCGGTFAYTSVMILINAMTPPHLIGLANGLAQSMVSLSRFCGPAMGGALWSASINGNPEGYASGFYTVACIATVQVLGSFLIR